MEYFERIKQRVIAYQDKFLQEEGDTARGVDWKSRGAQYLNFRVIESMGIREDSSVLDVGCGLAHFYDYLTDNGYSGRYVGVDISARMIEEAKARLPHVDLRVGDLLQEGVTPAGETYDFVVASGAFTLKLDTPDSDYERIVQAAVARMFELCGVGAIFNLLTSYVDYKVERLYYADPAAYLSYGKSLTRFVSLKHDYPAYFFTVGLYKQANNYYR